MKIKVLIFLFTFFLCFSANSQLLKKYTHNGVDTERSFYLSGNKVDQRGNHIYYVSTDVTFVFDQNSVEAGEGEKFFIGLNDLGIAVNTIGQNNILTVGKLRSSERVLEGDIWNVEMVLDVQFISNLKGLIQPLSMPVEDLMVDDDFLSFTVGKVSQKDFFAPHIKVIRKKALASDVVKLNTTLSAKQFVLTEFGNDRTLVSIDLAKLVDHFERGKKHKIEVTITPNLKEWLVFTYKPDERLKRRPKAHIYTRFRYSL